MADDVKPKKYRFLNGTDYLTKDGWKRAEVGDVRDDLLAKTAKWLLPAGVIEEVEETSDGPSS